MFDLIVLLIIIFFGLAGLRKGFWQYLEELLTIIISLIIAWCYYQKNHLIFTSLLVFIWTFLGLTVFRWFLLKIKRKREQKPLPISLANRFWGAMLGLLWGIFIASTIIFSLDLLPLELVLVANIKEKIQTSNACQILKRLIPIKKVTVINNISLISKIALDEQAKLKLKEQPQFQELLQHQSIKAIMEDPELIQKLQNKDLVFLLTHPKILNLLNDGQFIEKLMQLDFKQALEK